MHILNLKVSEIKEYGKNARYHTDQQIEQIKNSIIEYGFTTPVLIDEENVIIAGHGRKMAAIAIGMDLIPCIMLSGLTAEQKKAYRIADNRLQEGSAWDIDLLRGEVNELLKNDYNTDLLGFEKSEIEKLIDSVELPNENEPEQDDQGLDDFINGREPEAAAEPAAENDTITGVNTVDGEDPERMITVKIKIPESSYTLLNEFYANKKIADPVELGKGILNAIK